MAKDRLSMRKFKEVMRLKYEHELTNRKIACFDRCLHGPGRYLIVVPSEKSLKRARSKIYDMTIRRITAPVQKVIGAVNRFLTGWGNISDLVIPELHLKRSIGMCKRGSVALSGRGVTGAAGTLKARHCNKR